MLIKTGMRWIDVRKFAKKKCVSTAQNYEAMQITACSGKLFHNLVTAVIKLIEIWVVLNLVKENAMLLELRAPLVIQQDEYDNHNYSNNDKCTQQQRVVFNAVEGSTPLPKLAVLGSGWDHKGYDPLPAKTS